jgi:hypothetical protein
LHSAEIAAPALSLEAKGEFNSAVAVPMI